MTIESILNYLKKEGVDGNEMIFPTNIGNLFISSEDWKKYKPDTVEKLLEIIYVPRPSYKITPEEIKLLK